MICDDDPVMRSVIGRLLEGIDVEVAGEADTANAAVDLVGRVRPDIVVLDIAMPGSTGLAGITDLTAVSPTSRIIVCSAFDVSESAAVAAGAAAAVDKARLDRLAEVVSGMGLTAGAG